MAHLRQSPMFHKWHWLRWNFEHEMDVATETLDALLRCNDRMDGYATDMLDVLASLGGAEMDDGHYNQILQWYAELLVVHQLCTFPWPEGTAFEHEPALQGDGKNPEVSVRLPDERLLVTEVKAPELLTLDKLRSGDVQLLSRLDGGQQLVQDGAVPPRDNPVKDFLLSASSKFAGWHDVADDVLTVLVVVWDDYVQEAIAALQAPGSGLLTENSFCRDQDDNPCTFPGVDAVVLVRHLHQFFRALKQAQVGDERFGPLDYGSLGRFPPHALLQPSQARDLPDDERMMAFQAHPIDALYGAAEYSGAEMVFWFGDEAD